ncbi:CBS domain-containing protein [Hazenella coriacea]|uniref:CBS domain-containing protein n=1 Tax=Hazenella coriacea TaxID=1179467 RepID=A0A4R3L5L3_9BACL|nr:CBS domain-containing protein [Hazenella coriacea]TCS95091.1 CBS domain-containing protein [Hazenella coriacea]
MFIKNCLTPAQQIKTVTPDMSLQSCLNLLEQYQLDSIPVVDEKGGFVGITGYSYIFKALITEGKEKSELDHLPISISVHPMKPLSINATFEQTLPVTVRYPFVPIVDEDGSTFAGIVKISHIEAILEDTYGLEVPGVRFLLGVLLDSPHILSQVIECIKPFDINIINLVTFDAGERAARRIILKVNHSPYTQQIRQALEEKGFRVLDVRE